MNRHIPPRILLMLVLQLELKHDETRTECSFEVPKFLSGKTRWYISSCSFFPKLDPYFNCEGYIWRNTTNIWIWISQITNMMKIVMGNSDYNQANVMTLPCVNYHVTIYLAPQKSWRQCYPMLYQRCIILFSEFSVRVSLKLAYLAMLFVHQLIHTSSMTNEWIQCVPVSKMIKSFLIWNKCCQTSDSNLKMIAGELIEKQQ